MASNLQVNLLMMLIFLKLQYCRVATMEIRNSKWSIANTTHGCVGSTYDGDIAIDSNLNFRRMLPNSDSATLVSLVPVLTVCPRGFGGRPYRDCLNPGPGIKAPSKGDNCGSPYNRACLSST